MATDENDTPEAADAATPDTPRAAGGLVRTIGIGAGLFALLLGSQTLAPVIGCSVFRTLTPGCPPPVDASADEGADGEADGKAVKFDPKKPPLFLAIDPPLIVNLQDEGKVRFLQVGIEFMSRDQAVIDAVTTHMPVVRNNLLMLLGGQTVDTLTGREGKEALRKQALTEVQSILRKNTGKAGLEDLYFTSFVVQ